MKKISTYIVITLLFIPTLYGQKHEKSYKYDSTRKQQIHTFNPIDSVAAIQHMQPEYKTEITITHTRDYPKLQIPDSWITYKDNILNSPYSKFIIPTSLITYGIIKHTSREDDLEARDEIIAHGFKRVSFDDFLQFAPIAGVYGLDLVGIKAKHNFIDRTFVGVTSHLIMASAVAIMKKQTNILRPDGSNYHSFPSGHTATAFVGAHMLFKEYKDTSPWISLTGYIASTATGYLRVRNNKHWVSDVITGAGIGILSVEIGYAMLPLFQKVTKKGKGNPNLVIAPLLGANSYGVGMAYTF